MGIVKTIASTVMDALGRDDLDKEVVSLSTTILHWDVELAAEILDCKDVGKYEEILSKIRSKRNQGCRVKSLYVAGIFNDHGGVPSKVAKKIFEALNLTRVDYYNGGHFQELEQILKEIEKYQVIYWFADVSNDRPKLVEEIKRRHNCILVTSKRNRDGKYSFQDLLWHALKIKSNLFIEFFGEGTERFYSCRIIDPLGNVFMDYSVNIVAVGEVLRERVNELTKFTRIRSESIGPYFSVPEEKDFFSLIKVYADRFHALIHAKPEAEGRFFGNASFRNPPPSTIFVTRRNIDKRVIDKKAFIVVKPELPVKYYGDYKPSVDTPVQIQLYKYYPKIKYMLHSHVYIEGALFTKRVIPCGALEEAGEIIGLYPNRNSTNFSVNLKGHGSLVLTDSVERLEGIPYIERKLPEYILRG